MQRRFPGQRPLRILVRTAHIGCVAMVLGSAAHGVDPGSWAAALLLTGALLVAEELYRHGLDWLRYLQAWAVLAKLGLVVLGAAWPEWLVPCLWAALVIGGVISHAPGSLRQRPLWGAPGPCASKEVCATG